MRHPATTMAWTFAVVFFGAAVLGFLPNPLLGEGSLFVTNTAHNLVHLLTAVAFAVVSAFGEGASTRFMQIFGVVYLLVGVLGFVTLGGRPEGHLLGIVHINQLDNVLHVGLGLAIGAAGWATRSLARRRPKVSEA